ncbi:MAG: hypothetical protein PVG72_06120 [Gammaproteobacteria bacterium]|jgi:hypothetical protein
MRYFPVILLLLAGLAGHCFAAEEQPADSGSSTAQPAAPAPEGGKDKQKPAEEEAEPDCD